MVRPTLQRRQFLGWTAGVAVCAGLAGCKTLNPDARTLEGLQVAGGRVELGAAGDLAVGGQWKVRAAGLDDTVLVARIAEDRYEAVSIVCPHMGSEVALAGGGDRFRCTAHGSEFSLDGEVLRGPASNRIREYEVAREGDRLYLVVS